MRVYLNLFSVNLIFGDSPDARSQTRSVRQNMAFSERFTRTRAPATHAACSERKQRDRGGLFRRPTDHTPKPMMSAKYPQKHLNKISGATGGGYLSYILCLVTAAPRASISRVTRADRRAAPEAQRAMSPAGEHWRHRCFGLTTGQIAPAPRAAFSTSAELSSLAPTASAFF